MLLKTYFYNILYSTVLSILYVSRELAEERTNSNLFSTIKAATAEDLKIVIGEPFKSAV